MKYIKPTSITWWASVVPLFLGLFIATDELHGLHQWVTIANTITGNVGPYPLINAGLAGIGLRGAIK